MNTLRKSFGSNDATLGAFLTCPSRINGDGSLAGTFRLANEKEQEQAPGGIQDRLRQPSAPQAGDVQILETDEIETVDKTACFLVGEVFALCLDAFVETNDLPHGFAAVAATLDLARHSALGAFQFLLGDAQEAQVGNLLAVAQGSERFQPHVNTDTLSNRHLRGKRQAVVHDDLSKPCRSAVDNPEQFLLSRDALITSTKMDQTQLRNREQIARADIGAGHKVFQRMVSCVRPEPWKAGLLSRLDAAKEGLHPTSNATERITGKEDRHGSEGRHSLAQASEPLALIVERKRFAAPPVRLDPMLKSLVVEPTTGTEPGSQSLLLSRGEIQFHLNCLEHEITIKGVEMRFKVSR